MGVREIILLAATQVGIVDEVEAYFDGLNDNGEKNADLLLTCFNVVENELALDYLPLTMEQSVTSTGKVFYTSLYRNAVRITEVVDENGQSVPFKLYASYMQVQSGNLIVRYTYTPSQKGLNESSDFSAPVSERLIAYGVAAEYCMATGLLSEAAVWDKKYKEGIEAIRRVPTAKRIQERRWV